MMNAPQEIINRSKVYSFINFMSLLCVELMPVCMCVCVCPRLHEAHLHIACCQYL